MINYRNLINALAVIMPVSVSFVAFNWYLSPCTVLCDRSFWTASPSADEVAAEMNIFTNVNNFRAPGLRTFVSTRGSFTPLHWAAMKGDAETVALLIDAGATATQSSFSE